MLVSTAIFSIVMVVALGALLSMSEANRRSEALNSAVNNLSAALDNMTRAIRTGTAYNCGISGTGDCPSGKSTISFTDSSGRIVQYCLNDGTGACTDTMVCSTGKCTILRQINGGQFSALTSPEVTITNLAFYVKGAAIGSADNTQPRVVVSMRGYLYVKAGVKSSFNIQTTVTQRVYDQ